MHFFDKRRRARLRVNFVNLSYFNDAIVFTPGVAHGYFLGIVQAISLLIS